MTAPKTSTAAERHARELARTPVPNPYRGQLSDPFYERDVPEDVDLIVPRGTRQVRQAAPWAYPDHPALRYQAPSTAIATGVISLVVGVLVGIFGLLLFAIVSFQHDVGAPDRTFYAGSDGAHVVMGFANLGLCACLVSGAIGLMMGKVTGRISLTIGHWVVLGFSVFWWREGAATVSIPIVLGLSSAAALLLSYQPPITRWLGVRPPPQPS
ncbi:MAG TPA: hypothetical protein VGH11_17540 [Jatrophihabitans sp.]|jgi:hypothetical protein